MRLDWILSPLTLWSALALSLFAVLFLFATFKKELAAVRRQANRSAESLAGNVETLTQEISGMRAGLQAAEAAPLVPATGESLTMTKRARALRMYRRGEPVSSIAASLHAPQNEIELLLKIDQFVAPQVPVSEA
jgi:hypothetical protein